MTVLSFPADFFIALRNPAFPGRISIREREHNNRFF